MIKCFNVNAKTPIGTKQGKISFSINGETLSGLIECMGEKLSFSDGIFKDNNFEFSGVAKKFIYKVPFTAKGIINKDNLTGVATTKYGKIYIDGVSTLNE